MWKNIDECINNISRAFYLTEQRRSKLVQKPMAVVGFSGMQNRHFLNNLLDYHQELNYLEIGAYRGATFIAAMYNNQNVRGIAVDSFDDRFSFGQDTEELYASLLSNTTNILTNNEHYEIWRKDFYDIKPEDLPKIDVYMFDGEHDMQSQFDAFNHIHESLADLCVVVIDDYNFQSVQEGTAKAIAAMPDQIPFNLFYHREIKTTEDGTHVPIEKGALGYWNGMYVAILERVK